MEDAHQFILRHFDACHEYVMALSFVKLFELIFLSEKYLVASNAYSSNVPALEEIIS